MMRVLMVSDVYFPRVNGVSTSIETFRRTLVMHGVEVRLVAPRYGTEGADAHTVRIAGRPLPNDPEDRLLPWRATHQAVLAAAADCDLIHIQTPFVAHYAGLAAARAFGLPAVVTYHTLFEEYLQHYVPFLPAPLLRRMARAFSRRQCNSVDRIIVPSSAMAARLHQYGVRRPCTVLPTGIPLQRFAVGRGQVFRAQHNIPAQQPLALFVGRVAHEKNIDFLLEAFVETRRLCPQALLLITGEGPAMQALRSHASQLGLADSVRFLGYLDRQQDLPDCYAAADLFVFASRTETQGLVLIEALAAGTPVVALAAMGTLDILSGTPGAIAAPDDKQAFGHIVGELLNNPARLQTLADEARLSAQHWSDSAMAARLAECYRHTVGEVGTAPRPQP